MDAISHLDEATWIGLVLNQSESSQVDQYYYGYGYGYGYGHESTMKSADVDATKSTPR